MSLSELRAIEPISIIDLDTDEPETGEPICERVVQPFPVFARAIGWRPACARLTSQRRYHIKQQARRR